MSDPVKKEIISSEKVKRVILVGLKIREQIEIRDSELVKLCNKQPDAHEHFTFLFGRGGFIRFVIFGMLGCNQNDNSIQPRIKERDGGVEKLANKTPF